MPSLEESLDAAPAAVAPLNRVDQDCSIPHLFARQVAACADDPAVVVLQETWSYQRLDEVSGQIAAMLSKQSGGPPGPVALLLPQDVLMIAAILGALKAGVIYVALDMEHPRERLRALLLDSGARMILTDPVRRQRADELAGDGLAVLTFDESWPSGDSMLLPHLNGQSLACVSYTSGSTGQPKGIVLDHGGLIRRACCFHHNANPTSEDRVGLITHAGLGAAIPPLFGSLLCGATLLPFSPGSAGIGQMADWLRRERITIIQSVPTVLRKLTEVLEKQSPLTSLRWVRMAGELLLPADLERFFQHFGPQCRFELAYATTETGTITQMELKRDTSFVHPLPVGFAATDTQVLILDQNGKEAARGEMGQIVVRGAYLNRGYWQPGGTAREAEMITHATGDLGRIRSDGALEWHGRNDDQVKICGQRVELGEVEAALRKLENVRDAAATVWEPQAGERKLVAYVTAKEPRYANPRIWRRQLRTILPAGLLPQALVVLDELPMGQGGKLDRAALPPPISARTGREILPGRDQLEKRLIGIWESVLGWTPIGRNDDVLARGGDSLQAAAIVSRVQEEFGRLPPLTLFLQAGTVAEQAKALSEQWAALCSTLVPIQPKGERPPLYFVHGAEGEVFHFWSLSRRLGEDRPLFVLQSPGVLGDWPARTLRKLAAVHAEQIMAHDPTGPCSLAGHCAGGLLALEIAQCLAERGKRVEQVVLIDASVPNQMPGTRQNRRHKRWGDSIGHFFRAMRWRLLLATDEIRGRSGRRAGAAYRRFVEQAFREALRHYVPRRYTGRVLALMADGPDLTEEADPRFRLVRDYLPQCRIERVPGSHVECLRMPHVEAMAGVVRKEWL